MNVDVSKQNISNDDGGGVGNIDDELGISAYNYNFDAIDFKEELLKEQKIANGGRVRFTFDTGRTPLWAAAIQRQYKLVISSVDVPWLFDLEDDPYELINYFDESSHADVRDLLLKRLYKVMEEHSIPLSKYANIIFWNTPNCVDSKDRIAYTNGQGKVKALTCDELDRSSNECDNFPFRKLCPVTCGTCCEDSLDKVLWLEGELRTCDELLDQSCNKRKVQQVS